MLFLRSVRYKPHMLDKDSHLIDYDKFFILKRLSSFTLTEFYRIIGLMIWYTAQTVTGSTISYVHSRCSCLYTQLYRLDCYCIYLLS